MRWARFAVGAQLALILAVCHLFALEAAAFREVLAITSLGWLLQHAVPLRLRLAWFLLIACASLLVALGVGPGLWLLGIGGGLVALCLLPGSRWRRLAAVLAAAAALVVLRTGPWEPPFGLSAWPILASLFLFRAISFLYDRHHETEPPPAGLVAAYFFLPPNACFPVFPVVDFGALRRGHDPAAGPAVHQEGVERIVRGLLQLLFYRVVYHLAVVPIEAVTDAETGVRFLVTNVLLIVRIMGMFHVSIGILHLFGFRLPPTTHLPFLSPGFSEFWRRANVYWRDFVVKVFFYPVYFQLKRFGRRPAQAVATLATFAAAWFLHAYQFFWFQGEFPLRWQDGIYWSSFGLLVMANGLFASRGRASAGRARHPAHARASVAAELARAARIAGTFGAFTVLWSIWMAPSGEVWLHAWRIMAEEGAAASRSIGIVLGGLAVAGILWPDASPGARAYFAGRHGGSWLARPWSSPTAALGALTVLLLLGVPGWAERLAPEAERLVWAMSETRANRYDGERRTEGYYQELAEIPRLDTPEWLRGVAQPDDWKNWYEAGLTRDVSDIRWFAYRPNLDLVFKRARLTTNSWGMRDREYPREKPPGALRIALLGASSAAGSGVADAETFEARAERQLAEARADAGLAPVEILNFAAPGYRPARALHQLRRDVLEFDPDWVVVAFADHTWRSVPKEVATALDRGLSIDSERIRGLAEPCDRTTPPDRHRDKALQRCLRPLTHQLLETVAGEMAELSRERGFGLVWLELPTTGYGKRRGDSSHRHQIEEAGFAHVDISDAWEGESMDRLRAAPWDHHPSALGHQLIADRWVAELAANPALLEPPDAAVSAAR